MSDHFSSPPRSSRNTVIVGSVILFHIAALWALQSGLVRKAADLIIPVEILSQFIDPPKPVTPAPPPLPPLAPAPPQRKLTVPAPPRPTAIQTPSPTPASPDAPTSAVAPPLEAPAPVAAPAPIAAVAPPAPAPVPSQLPSSNADYLQNPKPIYPSMSRRLGEQGKTIVRVLIGIDGLAKHASILQSSGFDRLDDAARLAVMGWRYVPGKRNGVAEPMEFNVPVNWTLD